MIDICIVTHNNLNFLHIFVDYLFENTKDFKLYVSDSGSDDNVCRYLSKLKEKYPDVITFRHTDENHGWTKGINWGISEGSSEYILITNYDIILPPDWFEKMKAHLREDVGAVGAISNVVSGRQKIDYSYGQYEDEVNLLIGFCILTKREILNKVGLLDEHYFYGHDDYDFSIRLTSAGYKLIIARDVFVKHFCYNSLSELETRNPELFKEGQEYTIRKHGHEKYQKAKEIKPTIVIATPFNGDVDIQFVNSMLKLDKPGGTGAVVFSNTNRTLIAIARNLLVESVLDYDSQWLLFIDSDMIFGRQSLMRLLKMAVDYNLSVIGALAHKRVAPFEPCIFNRVKNKWKYCLVPEVPGLYEVDGIGMAFTLIKTEVFKSLKKPYFYTDKNGQHEDLNFCIDAKKAGYKIYVDTSVQVGHLGERLAIDNYLVKGNEDIKEDIKKGFFIKN